MASFIHSILRTNTAILADGDETMDLPVNPLSVILLHLMPLNECTAETTYSFIKGLLAALVSIRVSHKGSAVVDLNGYDLAMVDLLYHRTGLFQCNAIRTDDDRRSLTVPIIFGRNPYMPSECFPVTKKGELHLTITWDIAATAYDGLRRSIETIELPDATPDFVQKVTTLAQTFAALGQNDVDLPIGNVIRAILLWGATGFAGATPLPTWGQLELMMNNRQTHYSASDFEVSRAIAGLCGCAYPPSFDHYHGADFSGAAYADTEEPQTSESKEELYTLLHLDPTRDDEYSLVTDGAARVNVRADCETIGAVRVLPIEKVPVGVFMD